IHRANKRNKRFQECVSAIKYLFYELFAALLIILVRFGPIRIYFSFSKGLFQIHVYPLYPFIRDKEVNRESTKNRLIDKVFVVSFWYEPSSNPLAKPGVHVHPPQDIFPPALRHPAKHVN